MSVLVFRDQSGVFQRMEFLQTVKSTISIPYPMLTITLPYPDPMLTLSVATKPGKNFGDARLKCVTVTHTCSNQVSRWINSGAA